MPLLSLIMPMHNAQRHVRAALRSVLADRDVPMQVIVVDDQSTDRSAAIVRQFGDQRINMIPGPGTGIADAFNAGLAVATGQVVMRCDADDLYPPGRIQRQLAFLQQHPDFGAVCGAFDAIDSTGQQVSDLNHSEDACEITDELRDGQTRTHLCTFAVRTEHLRRLGGCRSYFVTAEDVDLQLRLPMACRVWYEPECAYHYRLHDASITHRQADPVRRFYEETARLFAQQREDQHVDALELGCPPLPPEDRGQGPAAAHQHIQGMLLGMAWRQRRRGRRWKAIRLNLRACRHRPASLPAWRSLLAMILKD